MIQFLFPYRRDSVERENNLNEVLQFYKSKFPNEKFLVVEVGDEKTYNGDIPSVFQKQPLPHNQSKTINFGIENSTEDVLCIVDSDIILLEYENIRLAHGLISSKNMNIFYHMNIVMIYLTLKGEMEIMKWEVLMVNVLEEYGW